MLTCAANRCMVQSSNGKWDDCTYVDLGPFIVLLFFNFGLIVEKTRSFQLRIGTSFYGQRPLVSRHNHVSK